MIIYLRKKHPQYPGYSYSQQCSICMIPRTVIHCPLSIDISTISASTI